MKIETVEFDCILPLQATFVCDMRPLGVSLYIGFKTCGDHYHIGALEFDANGSDHPVNLSGDGFAEKFASASDCVAALAQIVEDAKPGFVVTDIPFTLVVGVDENRLAYELSHSIHDQVFGGMADFNLSGGVVQ